MYVRLSRTQNVKGFLPAYGLFKDMEGGPLLLILPFGGASLFTRETERDGGIYLNSVTVSESERYVINPKTICELPSDEAFFAVKVSSMHCGVFTMAEFCMVTFAPRICW